MNEVAGFAVSCSLSEKQSILKEASVENMVFVLCNSSVSKCCICSTGIAVSVTPQGRFTKQQKHQKPSLTKLVILQPHNNRAL